MLPLVDTHCHLLAGLDDGPPDWEAAIEMCRLSCYDGVRAVAATAHQNDDWPLVTPERILAATRELQRRVDAANLPLAVYPCAEAMVHPELDQACRNQTILSVSNQQRYLLIELPHGLFVDLRPLIRDLMRLGLRPILAHPERHPELLHGAGLVEDLIRHGCLIQVSAESITQQTHPAFVQGIRQWARRGIMHLVASDGHSPDRRPPGISVAFHRLMEWIGAAAAERICSMNGMAVLEGLPLNVPQPAPPRKRWFGWRR